MDPVSAGSKVLGTKERRRAKSEWIRTWARRNCRNTAQSDRDPFSFYTARWLIKHNGKWKAIGGGTAFEKQCAVHENSGDRLAGRGGILVACAINGSKI